MDSVITQTLYFIASYLGLIFAFFFATNWLTKGFFLSYLRVKSSRGKKVLVEISGIDTDYYKIGFFKGKEFHFKDKSGESHRIPDLKKVDVSHKMGVSVIKYDLPSGNVINVITAKQTCDPVEVDNFYNRILMAPRSSDEKFRKTVVILLIVILVGVLVVGGLAYNNYNAISGLKLAGVIA